MGTFQAYWRTAILPYLCMTQFHGSRQKIPFGLKDGRLFHVLDVPGKSACDCVCPGCGGALVAINAPGRQVIEHFRHKAAVDCQGGVETAIHRAAKQVLLQTLRTALPDVSEEIAVTASDGTVLSETLSLPSTVITAASGEEEPSLDGYRPDVQFLVDDHRLNIEILVTHAVDAGKAAKVVASGQATMEIDLSHLTFREIHNMTTFTALVCEAVPHRQWIYSPRLERARERVRVRLNEQLAAYEEELARQREEQAARDKAWALQHQQEVLARHRAREQRRRHHPDAIALLGQARDPVWIEQRLQQLRETPRYALQQPTGGFNVEALFVPVPAAWIFEAAFTDWQAFILDTLFPPTPSVAELTPAKLADKVVRHFGLLPGTLEAVQLETDQRLYPNAPCHDVLTIDEFRLISSPLQVVMSYLMHLRTLGLANTQLTELLGDRKLPLPKVLALAASQSRQVGELSAPAVQLQERQARHALAARASAQMLYEQGHRQGYRCSVCYLMSVPGYAPCPFCGEGRPAGRPVTLDTEFLRLERYKIRTTAAFLKCVAQSPELQLSTLSSCMDRLTAKDTETLSE